MNWFDDPDRRGGWWFRPEMDVTGPLDFQTRVAAATDGPPVDLHLVYTDDGLYVPAIVRTPQGPGPFPTIVAMHGGSGGLGISWLVDFVLNRGYALDRFLEAGYAVCFTEGRMEIEDAYPMEPNDETTPPIPAVLDHHDIIAVYRYLQSRGFVDADRIGFFGVSHGGELQMKVISEIGDGPAALVPMEPAVTEYLELEYDTERPEFYEPFEDSQIGLENAMDRIERIDDSVPILVGGRDGDHNQGTFHKLYELLDRAGKNVDWVSWDHPNHAFHWGPRRSESVGGYHGSNWLDLEHRYDVDETTEQALDRIVTFLDEHVRD